jgi:hypothetical protein
MDLVRSKDGIEAVIKSLDGKLSEAIMYAMENGPELEKKVSHMFILKCFNVFSSSPIIVDVKQNWIKNELITLSKRKKIKKKTHNKPLETNHYGYYFNIYLKSINRCRTFFPTKMFKQFSLLLLLLEIFISSYKQTNKQTNQQTKKIIFIFISSVLVLC